MQGSTGQGSAGQGSTVQGSTGQDSAGQGSPVQGRKVQDSAVQDRSQYIGWRHGESCVIVIFAESWLFLLRRVKKISTFGG